MKSKTIILIIVVLAIVGVIGYLESQKVARPSARDIIAVEVAVPGPEENGLLAGTADPTKTAPPDMKVEAVPDMDQESRISEKLNLYERAKEITTPDGFINTDSVTISELVGKRVILVDFWTYSCINCQRTLPYLKAWHDKYADKGLAIIGVHTPEFDFEKKYENVVRATEKFDVQYPVVLDNDYSTWFAYRNRYWPRKYLIDIDGFIVYDHIGEGAYKQTEAKIQELLEERMKVLEIEGVVDGAIAEPEDAERVDATKLRSPEVYFGALRNQLLGNGPQGTVGTFSFDEPAEVLPNVLYLVGDWEITPEYAEAKSDGALIIFRYQAEKVFMVAGAEGGVTARLRKDGQVIGLDGLVGIKEETLYRLIEDDYGEHTLEIMFLDSGAQVFTFTFG